MLFPETAKVDPFAVSAARKQQLAFRIRHVNQPTQFEAS
jgi:hypothetical protein